MRKLIFILAMACGLSASGLAMAKEKARTPASDSRPKPRQKLNGSSSVNWIEQENNQFYRLQIKGPPAEAIFNNIAGEAVSTPGHDMSQVQKDGEGIICGRNDEEGKKIPTYWCTMDVYADGIKD